MFATQIEDLEDHPSDVKPSEEFVAVCAFPSSTWTCLLKFPEIIHVSAPAILESSRVEDFEVWVKFPRNRFGRHKISETFLCINFSQPLHSCSRIFWSNEMPRFKTLFSTSGSSMNSAISRTESFLLLSFSEVQRRLSSMANLLTVSRSSWYGFQKLPIFFFGICSQEVFLRFRYGKCNSCRFFFRKSVSPASGVGNAVLTFG